MTSESNEFYDLRPKAHFAPKEHWHNDPNGLIYKDGLWHMYFQYYPYNVIWGPMHWGHAISRDLIHWEELPIALEPDRNGYIYSGSMVYDKDNTSGFGKVDPETGEMQAPMVAVFTHHDPKTWIEVQNIAYSLDGGTTFEKYAWNPVIGSLRRDGYLVKDFRDPKVFWNKKKSCWTMTVAAFDRCNFYASKDLIHWEKTGEFRQPFPQIPNCWACTDLIPFDTEDGELWVLLASMEYQPWHPEAHTMYFIGHFDGDTFTAIPTQEPMNLDFGWDNYAGVSFNDVDRPIMISWGVNPCYAFYVPTDESGFRGIMTTARELSLKKTEEGYRLAMAPVGFEDKQANAQAMGKMTAIKNDNIGLKLHGTFGKVILENANGERAIITLTEDSVTVDRREAGRRDFHPAFNSDEYLIRTVPRLAKGDVDTQILFDVSNIEVFADQGLEVASMNVYPRKGYEQVRIEGDLTAEWFELV